MGELEGVKGAWAYVQGGMGAVSEACASAARVHGASIFTDKVSVNDNIHAHCLLHYIKCNYNSQMYFFL